MLGFAGRCGLEMERKNSREEILTRGSEGVDEAGQMLMLMHFKRKMPNFKTEDDCFNIDKSFYRKGKHCIVLS